MKEIIEISENARQLSKNSHTHHSQKIDVQRKKSITRVLNIISYRA